MGNESNSRETLKSSPLLNNRREQRAYITHLDRSERKKLVLKNANKNTNTGTDKKYITNFDRHSAKDRATILAPTPQSSPKKSPKTSRSLGKSQSKDPGKTIRVQKKNRTQGLRVKE